jgi:sulfur-oxidizing protein SoxY
MQALDRRQFVLCGAAVAATVLVAGTPFAQEPGQGWEEAVRKILGDTKPLEGKVTFDMPEIAENGNTVPFTINVESPMSNNDYIKAIHVLSTGNPQPGVASFRLTPQSGKASVASRMRLARTQDVIVLAEASDGKFWQARRSVKVTIGGCGG